MKSVARIDNSDGISPKIFRFRHIFDDNQIEQNLLRTLNSVTISCFTDSFSATSTCHRLFLSTDIKLKKDFARTCLLTLSRRSMSAVLEISNDTICRCPFKAA